MWKLNHEDILEIRNLIDLNDSEKTGKNVWLWFRENINSNMYTEKKFKHIGDTFLKHLNNF